MILEFSALSHKATPSGPIGNPSSKPFARYAQTYNGYKELGDTDSLFVLREVKWSEFHRTRKWLGNMRELRALLFFEQRGWRQTETVPEGSELEAIYQLMSAILTLVAEGQHVPNSHYGGTSG